MYDHDIQGKLVIHFFGEPSFKVKSGPGRERLFDGRRRHDRARPSPVVRVRSGACSSAETKGEGAPTGMSTTAAVAGRPIHT
jgi:hypothetical protein